MDIPKLHQLAVDVQDKSDNAFYLLGALDDAFDDATDLSDPSDTGRDKRGEAMARVAVFLRLAKEATRITGAAGEEIERLAGIAKWHRENERKRTA